MIYFLRSAVSIQSAIQLLKKRPLNSGLIDAHGKNEKIESIATQDKGNY